MQIFLDKERKRPIDFLHFGKVKVGETKEITVYLYNDAETLLTNLVYDFPGLPKGEILEIVYAPITIQPGGIQPLTLKWSPSRQFKRALEVGLLITGEEVFLAKRFFKA